MQPRALKGLIVAALLSATLFATPQVYVPPTSVRSVAPSWRVHTNYELFQGIWRIPHVVRELKTRQGVLQGYYPQDIRQAYGIPSTGGSGAIAIIEAYDLPTGLNDFNTFASEFALPTESSSSPTASTNQVFQVVYAAGSKPSADPNWGGEIALDMEWAHAMAPNAKIYVIECASDNFNDILVGVQAAAQLPDVREVSMSFGSSESNGEASFDSRFTTPNQVFFAAAGDTSNERDYPAASPNVIGVGGTTLNVTSSAVTGVAVSETAWSEGGGGPSSFEPLPSYQQGILSVTRAIPDVAADADPNTGCAVYDSTPIPHEGSGWMVDGGTSLATPIEAGITNVRGSFSTSSFAELVRQYSLAGSSSFRDITSGTSGIYSAARGYDFVTGLGAMTNLFPTAVYSPVNLTLPYGTPVSGIPDNVIAKDNHDYVLRSSPASDFEQTAQLSGDFMAPLSVGQSRASASLSVTGFSTAPTTSLYLYNIVTSQWDMISALNFGQQNTSLSIPIPNPGDYFDPNGNVMFEIVGQGAVVFQLGLDQIQLNVTAIE